MINLINSNLPADIRVYTMKLVTQLFDVRKSARCRLYEYITPICVYQSYEEVVQKTPPTEEFRLAVFERLSGVIKKFLGSHNFHNYSRGLKAKDASANRYIMKMELEPIQYKDHWFLKFRIEG